MKSIRVTSFFITPDSTSWDPYCGNFSENEDTMLGPDGEIIQKNERVTHLVYDHEVRYSELPNISSVDSTIYNIIRNLFHNINEVPQSEAHENYSF